MAERRPPSREGIGRGDHPPGSQYPTHVQIITPRVNAVGVRAQNLTVMASMTYGHYQRRPPADDVEDQALREPRPIEDVSCEFSQDELDRHIEEKYLSYVANSSGAYPNWRRLARKLQLDQATVDRLEHENSDNVREFMYKMMLSWKRRHPSYKVKDLVHVLCHARLHEAARELKKYFRSLHD